MFSNKFRYKQERDLHVSSLKRRNNEISNNIFQIFPKIFLRVFCKALKTNFYVGMKNWSFVFSEYIEIVNQRSRYKLRKTHIFRFR
jgi:hypothetical protein